jgi:hypothetical protein
MANKEEIPEFGTPWEDDEVKVVIGVPCSDRVMFPQTAHAIGGVIIASEGTVVDYILRMGCDIVSSRTGIVREALKKGATHLLFVDSDMVFSKDTLTRLLAHDKDIVGVKYNRRRFPLEGTWKSDEESETSLFKAKYCGTGLMLVNLRIFEKEWKSPWFNFGRDSEGMLSLGEDAWFCFAANDEGFETWVDPTIKVGHLGEYTY